MTGEWSRRREYHKVLQRKSFGRDRQKQIVLGMSTESIVV